MLRARPTLGQLKVHIHEIPRAVEIYVNKATLDPVALEHFPDRFGSLFGPAMWDIGKGAEVEGGRFGTVEEGRPTFELAVPVAPQVLGIDDDLVPVATYK